MAKDHMLGRARRAVLAVTGTAEGMFGGWSRRTRRDQPPRAQQASPPRPEPQAGLPPRIERERPVALPPRVGSEPTAGLPPRVGSEATAGPPPRIERRPVVEPPPQIVPEPAAEPVRQREPPPPRTTRRAGIRAHLWFTGIVCLALAVGLTGYWVLRVHQRIGQATLEHEIGTREGASTVGCSKLQSDGAVWACALIYRAESVCLIAKVNALGSWSTAIGQHRCAEVARLRRLLPPKSEITAAAVAADVDRQLGSTGAGPGTQCIKEPAHKVRWACQRPPPPGSGAASGACEVVRVQPWNWNFLNGGRLCAHLPDLVKKVRAAGNA